MSLYDPKATSRRARQIASIAAVVAAAATAEARVEDSYRDVAAQSPLVEAQLPRAAE